LVGFLTGFILVFCVIIAGKLTGYPSGALLARMKTKSAMGYVFGILGFVMYGAVAEGLHGGTLGKRLLGMAVLKETKRPCGFFSAVGCQVAFLFDSLFFGLVGAYGMSTNHRDQRYGDQWFKTVVVKRTSVPPEVLRSDLRFVGAFLLAILVDAMILVFYFTILAGR
jgi:uncharacterized RDD family membrane protein YckC